MLLDVLVGIPPIPRTPMTSNDIVVSWVTIGIIVALALVAWIMIVIAAFRSVQKRQSEMKEAEREYEEVPQSTNHAQPQVQLPKEEVLSRR